MFASATRFMNGRITRISVFVALLWAVLLTAGCASARERSQNVTQTDGRLSIVTTIFAPYDFSRKITGGLADITMLLPPASESHSFEPTPQDVITIQNSDLFIYAGGESDAWVDKLLSSTEMSGIKTVTLMDCVEAVEEEIIIGMQHDESESETDNNVAYDEHVWTSPRNAVLIVEKIRDALCEIDETNTNTYQQNADAYKAKLNELDTAFSEVVDNGKRKTILFGDRFPFRYFADAYGLTYYAAFPGCASEAEPSAATVAFLIDKIREEQIPVVFHAELSNEKIAEIIADETDAQVLLLHACHNISRDDFTSGIGYLELMTRNVDALRKALN